MQPEFQAFIKQLKLDRFPEKITSQYDQWTIRSLLLKPKHQSKAPNKEFFSNETSAAPLTYLVVSGQNPVEFLENTWKWSIPPGRSSSSSVSGASGYSGRRDSGGGSDGSSDSINYIY